VSLTIYPGELVCFGATAPARHDLHSIIGLTPAPRRHPFRWNKIARLEAEQSPARNVLVPQGEDLPEPHRSGNQIALMAGRNGYPVE
jgi:hypothetical protein